MYTFCTAASSRVKNCRQSGLAFQLPLLWLGRPGLCHATAGEWHCIWWMCSFISLPLTLVSRTTVCSILWTTYSWRSWDCQNRKPYWVMDENNSEFAFCLRMSFSKGSSLSVCSFSTLSSFTEEGHTSFFQYIFRFYFRRLLLLHSSTVDTRSLRWWMSSMRLIILTILVSIIARACAVPSCTTPS